MPKDYPRSDRVEEQVREVLSEAIQELKDPRVGFVTVTAVKMTPDLRKARVYISAFGDPDKRMESIEAIQHAAPHLRSAIGNQVRLKFLPFLEILEDTTADVGERIESLLREAGVSKAPEVSSEEGEESE